MAWTEIYPLCSHVRGYASAKRDLVLCLNRDKPNLGARDHVTADFDKTKMVIELIGIYKGAAHG